jgi:hypothetical protein
MYGRNILDGQETVLEAVLFVCLAALLDPVRWVFCVLSAWFIRSYVGALAVGIGFMVGLTVTIDPHVKGLTLFGGGVASAIIISIFYFWRKHRREKAAKEPT